MFFRGAGVPDALTADVSQRITADKESINKYEIVRTLLGRLNDADAEMLAQRREVIKRVCELEAFSSCWDDDRLRAKGLVSEIRDHVRIKDSFTRMQQERDAAQKAAQAKARCRVGEDISTGRHCSTASSGTCSPYSR